MRDGAEIVVAVVGLGSRGLSVFERLVTMAGERKAPRLRIEVIDPDCAGSGIHATDQPDYLLLNTTCANISMFPDRHTLPDDGAAAGPNLYEWVLDRGLKLGADGCTMGEAGRSPYPTDFLPRRTLGEYLEWFRRRVESRLPTNVHVNMRRAVVSDIVADGEGTNLHLSDGGQLSVDYLYLTIGHACAPGLVASATDEAAHLIEIPFPMRERLSAIAPGETVALAGFGLTAIDVVSTLTRGRGGQFSRRPDGTLRYAPSGKEPGLVLYSRSGAPFRARSRVCSFDRLHRPIAFTPQRIDAMRRCRGARELDFERDVMPLVHSEMRVAYRECQAENHGQADAADLAQRLRHGDLETMLAELDRQHGPFDPVTALDTGAGMRLAGASDYQGWFADSVRRDLALADLGVARSPDKAALDILRQFRDTFRHAVDFGGLTAESLEDFYRRVVPALNRAVVGPQYERHQELLALLEAGIVRTPLGPAPHVSWDADERCWVLRSTRLLEPAILRASWLCLAQSPEARVDRPNRSELVVSMTRRGMLRPFKPGSSVVPGAHIDEGQHPIGVDGRAHDRIWVLGPLCEGAVFYNHLLPSPNTWSRPIADAHRCVAELFARLSAGKPPSAPERRAHCAGKPQPTEFLPTSSGVFP